MLSNKFWLFSSAKILMLIPKCISGFELKTIDPNKCLNNMLIPYKTMTVPFSKITYKKIMF